MKRSSWLLLGLGLSTVAAACSDDEKIPAGSSGSAGQSQAGTASGGNNTAGSNAKAGSGGADANEAGSSNAGGAPEPNGGSSSEAGTGGPSDAGEPGANGGAGGAPEPVIDPECDYLEAADLTNDGFPQEETGLTLTTGTTVVICGQLDPGHFTDGLMDDDGFSYMVDAESEFIATLELESATYPGVVRLGVGSANNAGSPHSGIAVGKKAGAWSEHYTDGQAVVSVEGYADTDELEAPLKYKIRIRKESWRTDCTAATPQNAAQSYTEANDGADNLGNDVVRLDLFASEQAATPAADQVEASAIVLGANEHSLIQGSTANVAHGSEEYRDGDMYRFRSGDMEQLVLRLDWTSSFVDLDYFLFEENTYGVLASSITTDRPESTGMLLKPNKNYWLWIGGHKDSNVGELPQTYKITLCGDAFAY